MILRSYLMQGNRDMCGIVGAIAKRDVAKILIEGLLRLEYRGYDSAGIAVVNPQQQIARLRVVGKVNKLQSVLAKENLPGNLGIGHTRWATHGEPSKKNAHPHISADTIAVVHNGIIENHQELKQDLIAKGYKFDSATDTEVIAHLIHFYLQRQKQLPAAIQTVTKLLKGAYALGIICQNEPNTLFAVRHGSPLVIGLGIDENFIASDQVALLPVTQKFIYLEEGDIAIVRTTDVKIIDNSGKSVTRHTHQANASAESISKGHYRHFMQKEIFEQPQSLAETLETHLQLDNPDSYLYGTPAKTFFNRAKRVRIVACGTSYHAGLVASHWIESLANIPCTVEIASEYRYRRCVIEDDTLFIVISQSGETADTLAALRRAKDQPYLACLAVCNVAQSSLAREADLALITHAGTEIGVAATKTFTAQLVGLLMVAITLGKQQNTNQAEINAVIAELKNLPGIIQASLNLDSTIRTLSHRFVDKHHALFLGRGKFYPIALEGALKLKEISYIHAEAYPAGELKHGPLALVDDNMPVIVIAPNNSLLDKLQSNMQEVQARGGKLYVFADETINWHPQPNLHVIEMPKVNETIAPIIYTVPLQLLSYHTAVLKGTDVDQPRNLAKSVTVE